MSHTTASLWLAVALGALAWSGQGGGAGAAVLGGAAIGLAAATRPLTGLAIGAPMAGMFLLQSAGRPRLARAIVAGAAGLGLVGVLFLLYNAGTTGDLFLTGYRKFGDHVRLGFGGPMEHTPLKGLHQSLNNLWAHGRWGPGAFPGAYVWLGAFFLFTRFGRREAVLAAMWFAAPAAYFFYYYQDFALGPRFLFEIGPAGALLAARGLQAMLDAGDAAARHGRRSRLFAALGLGCALATAPAAWGHLADIANVHRNNRSIMAACRALSDQPDAALFIRSYLQGIIVEENLRHPQGPWLLLDQGDERNRAFMAAHPQRRFYITGGGPPMPYDGAP